MRWLMLLSLILTCACGKKINPSRRQETAQTRPQKTVEAISFDQLVELVAESQAGLSAVSVGQQYLISITGTNTLEFPEETLECPYEQAQLITIVEVAAGQITKLVELSELAANEKCDPYTAPRSRFLDSEKLQTNFDIEKFRDRFIAAEKLNEDGKEIIRLRIKGEEEGTEIETCTDYSRNYLVASYQVKLYKNGQLQKEIRVTKRPEVDVTTLDWESVKFVKDEF